MNKFLHNAQTYKIHRPKYPKKLYDFLSSLVPTKKILLDCGTGSGQAAEDLASYFEHVIAIDISFDLLELAPKRANLTYVQAKAESLPIQTKSIDLLTVSQAMHWFSLDEFYAEVNRILKPNGIIAAWCYNQCIINPKIDTTIEKIYSLISNPENLSISRQYVYDHYKTIPFPFKKINTPNFELNVQWDLKELLGYISTWPGLLEYDKKNHTNLLFEFENEFINGWGDINSKKLIKWPIYLLIGKLS